LALDPSNGEVVDHIGVGIDPDAVATGAGAVWVANRADGTLARVDPHTLTVTDVIPVGGNPVAVVADSRAVWVANAASGTITKVDPTTVRVVKTVRVDNAPSGVALTTGGLYVAVRGTGLMHRGGTLRVVTPQEFDSLDPALAYSPSSWSVLTSTNDGLVGFRRAAGIEGVGIVPDLAASLPAPADGGTSWTFRLRPDIRYSNGALVQPEDFRREFQRIFQLRKPASPAVGYFADIVGAAECTVARCDLSQGIVTDRISRTVTFRLTAPDGDFLTKLALPFAYPVPVSTPAREQSAHPVPATGPYMIASAHGPRVRLVRNPRFHEWSSDAQPAGYPDEIDWNVVQPTAGIQAVIRGKADAYLFVRGPEISKSQLNALATGYPSQLRVNTIAATHSFFLNSRVKPFTDVRVRRAVNYAFDRGAFARLLGRGVAATCQVLPPNSSSFRRTCQYVPNGAAGLDEARRLVRASGTVGQKVAVWIPSDKVVEGRFMVSVLRSLGYVARLHTVGAADYFNSIYDTRTQAQIGFNGWQADFPSASAFLTVQFACNDWAAAAPDQSVDPSFFCDRSLDRLMTRAGQVEIVNPPAGRALWQQAERQLLRAAPLVPTYNPQAFDFLAKRVGDYQYDPQWGALVDQLWQH
jgi:peptide/nickel transport system substrate-binding protein